GDGEDEPLRPLLALHGHAPAVPTVPANGFERELSVAELAPQLDAGEVASGFVVGREGLAHPDRDEQAEQEQAHTHRSPSHPERGSSAARRPHRGSSRGEAVGLPRPLEQLVRPLVQDAPLSPSGRPLDGGRNSSLPASCPRTIPTATVATNAISSSQNGGSVWFGPAGSAPEKPCLLGPQSGQHLLPTRLPRRPAALRQPPPR